MDSNDVEALEFVTNVLKPHQARGDQNAPQLPDCRTLLQSLRIARRNGVLLWFSRRLMKMLPSSHPSAKVVSKITKAETQRSKMYDRILKHISLNGKDKGIEFLVFKTLRTIPFVGNDIDILLRDEAQSNTLVASLKRNGFENIGKGLDSITLGKEIGRDLYLIDIHRKISTAGICYVDCDELWRRRRCVRKDGMRVNVPSSEDELVVLAIHSLMKEFRLPLADLLYSADLLERVNPSSLKIALDNRLQQIALSIFLVSTNCLARHFYDIPKERFLGKVTCHVPAGLQEIVEKDAQRTIMMPYHYPAIVPIVLVALALLTWPKNILRVSQSFVMNRELGSLLLGKVKQHLRLFFVDSYRSEY